jgi:DNA helicase-2/ATP-dependent DNA helicase PcrA
MSQDIILDSLNPEQKKAVQCTEGPLLVFAGAGSGKTRVITNRIAYLISEKKVSPFNILAVTFTKKAAGEMQERVVDILKSLNLNPENKPLIGTFHSIGALLLRQNPDKAELDKNFSIYDTDDVEKLIKEIMTDQQVDTKQIRPKSVMSYIETSKNDLVSPRDFSLHYGGFIEDIVAEIYPEYQKQLKAQNAVDFGDLLYLTVKMLEENKDVLEKYQEKFKYILIDEYQDTNTVQYKFAKLISGKYNNICVVGDDDQGIYAWRGADIKNIQQFEKDFPDVNVVKLEQNYRSTGNVIEAASSVISRNNLRVEKKLWTEKGNGDQITMYQAEDQNDEAKFVVDEVLKLQKQKVKLTDIAVLYRTNYQSRVLEEEMLRNGLPYKLVGGFRFYERKEIKDILSYVRIIHNLKDDLSFNRIVNVPSRKVGPKSVGELHSLAKGCNLPVMKILLGAYMIQNNISNDHINIPLNKVKGSLEKIIKYSKIVDIFGSLYFKTLGMDISEVIDEILKETKYIEWMDDGSEEAEYKKENIEELRNVASEYTKQYGKDSLEMFLQDINLIEQEQDKNKDGTGSYVNLMTLHSSKGLEFKYVFIVGMEEGILPHSRSFVDENGLEEERRLCYVGITRAKEKLYLSFAENRQTREGYSSQIPSRFLGEIPQNLCEFYSWNP